MLALAEFRRAHQHIVDLVEDNPAFKRFVEDLDQNQLRRLAAAVAILEDTGDTRGRTAVVQAYDDGLLRRVVDLPDAGLAIAQDLGSLETALSWQAVVPGRLQAVEKLGLHRQVEPRAERARSVERLLDLGETAGFLLGLPWPDIEALVDLPRARLRDVEATLEPALLSPLAQLLRDAPNSDMELRGEIVATVLGPGRGRQLLHNRGLATAVIDSRDPRLALSFVQQPGAANLFFGLWAALTGQINLSVVSGLYPGVWVFFLVPFFLFLFLFYWLQRKIRWLAKMIIAPFRRKKAEGT